MTNSYGIRRHDGFLGTTYTLTGLGEPVTGEREADGVTFRTEDGTPGWAVDRGFWDVAYAVTDAATGDRLGTVEDDVPLFGRRWRVDDGTTRLWVRTAGWRGALVDFVETGSPIDLPIDYVVVDDDGRRVGSVSWRGPACVVDLETALDPRLVLAAVLMMDVGELSDREWSTIGTSDGALGAVVR